MFGALLTYYQVNPTFLDFAFSFGRRGYAQDCPAGGFRSRISLSKSVTTPDQAQLGRSGFGFQQCYGLRSVESINTDEKWPWSVRHAAVHHSFDVYTGQAFWILIKANLLLKARMRRAVDPIALRHLKPAAGAFAMTLEAHMVVVEWANDEWRRYLEYLEDRIQTQTRRALNISIIRSRSSPETTRLSRAATMIDPPGMVRTSSWRLQARRTLSWAFEPRDQPAQDIELTRPVPSPPRFKGPEEEAMSFDDFQDIQYIEEKVNEACIALRINLDTISKLREQYSLFCDPKHNLEAIRLLCEQCSEHIVEFDARIAAVIDEMKMHQATIQAIIHLLSGRKNLASTVRPEVIFQLH